MNQTINREILEISIEDIVPNRFQPRLTFDTEALNELANSIKEHGIIQPLVVRRLNDKFEIIAGERRYKASTLVGMKKVPCVVMELSDNESAEVAVIENIQRKEMTPLEEAKAFKKILDKGYLTQDTLARRMGKSQSSIANKLRLLNLDEVVQDAILDGKISERHARSLLKIEDKIEQRNVLGEIINNRLTVRQTDELIKEKYNKGDDIINTNENSNQINNVFNNEGLFKNTFVEEPRREENTVNQQLRYLSTPEVNIPMHNVTNDINPQLNIMNNIGIIDTTKKNEPEKIQTLESTPSPSLDIFKFDNNLNKKEETNVKDINIQDVINPSVFSTDSLDTISQNLNNNIPENPPVNYNNYQNPMNIDITSIKNNAEDIIKKQEEPANIQNLLSKNNKPENKFFIDLDMPANYENNSTLSSSSIARDAVNEIEKKIEELKLKGINIIKEQNDLGNMYQIVIRIDK